MKRGRKKKISEKREKNIREIPKDQKGDENM